MISICNRGNVQQAHTFSSRRAPILFSLLLLAASLSACGGGGGSSSSSGGGGTSTSTSPNPTIMTVTPTPSAPVSVTAASRLLEQSSFGPTAATIAHVQQIGINAYLDEQFSVPSAAYDDVKSTDNGLYTIRRRFFKNALTGTDQLRQRVAFALGQIFVISAVKVSNPNAFVPYERLLLSHAFGNYYDLLHDVTLNPSMGYYLDMANNDGPQFGTNPNENYAREVLQLFSIGVIKLNPDGTAQLDANGNTIPTYTQNVVEGFARVFTGWTYPTMPGATPQAHNSAYYYGPMEANEFYHANGEKLLLDGVTLPAGQTAAKDLSDALHSIFNHPNVGPFISFRLIQNLVTSNPSPAYVQRVASVFNNNGAGVRGDLKAVIRAILTDNEARRGDDPSRAITTDGKLKDPILYATGMMRSLEAKSDCSNVIWYTMGMLQYIFSPPTVFNYYPPNYSVPGAAVLGPEFSIRNNPTMVVRNNFAFGIINNLLAPETTVDLSYFINLAGNATLLVDAVNNRLMRGAMSSSMRAILINAVNALPVSDPVSRARTAIFLVVTSSQYNIQH